MEEFSNKVQSLMNEFYNEWQKEENKGKSKWDVLGEFSEAHQIAVAFGNFNYQVENGGIHQWIYNGYFYDDAEKLTEYLESGKGLDERCQKILDTVYKIEQNARDTDCDRDGHYTDPDDEDGEWQFIGDMINCDAFDIWYYEHCDGDDWWKTVCGVIEKVTGHELAPVLPEDKNERVSESVEPASAGTEPTKGYVIAVADDGDSYFSGVSHVQRNDGLHIYTNDEAAARAAELDGINLIYNMPNVPDGIYVDTPENREVITKHFEQLRLSSPAEPDVVFDVHNRLEECLEEYKEETLCLKKSEIYESAVEIATMLQAYEYFIYEHPFTTGQAEFLLKFQNPLELLSDKIPLGYNLCDSAEYILSEEHQEQILKSGSYELISDDSVTPQDKTNTTLGSGEKPSVIDEIRQSQKDAREHPPTQKDKSLGKAARNNSDQDL